MRKIKKVRGQGVGWIIRLCANVTHNSKPLIREKDCFSFLYSLSYVSLLPKYVMSKEVIIEIGKGKVV